MSSLLARLARTLSHHWKRSLAAALAIIVVLGIVAGTSSPAPDDFSAPGTETQKALDLLSAHSPALAGSEATVVFTAKDGKITDPQNRQAVTSALAKIKPLVGRGTVSDPFAKGGTVSPDGTIAAVDVRYTTEPQDLETEDGKKLEDAARTAEKGGTVDVAMRGVVVDIAAEQDAPVGELVGIAIAIVLLTLLFRSGAAMAATIFGALLGVMVGQLLLTALAKPLGLPEFASIIAVMLGLGAGIDYALLIIGRYREQVAAGDSVRDAAAKAAATSGSSVVAAGLIVMVAIAGLLVIGIPMIGKMGIGAAIGVAAVVVSALTVLPIMIGALKRWLTPKKAAHVAASPGFRTWAERITARPWLSILAGVVILLVFAAPVTQMRLGQPDDGNQPTSKTQRVAYDQLAKAFGPGYNGPFLLAIDTGGAQKPTQQQLAKLQAAVANAPGMVKQSVSPATPTPDGKAAIIFGTPTSAPQDAKTSDTLATLRDDAIPQATKGTPLEGKVYVGGNTAGFEDFSDKVASRLPVFIALVIGLSVLLLMAAFRSLWIPLVSAVFNLLSVGAAYGVVVAVFQKDVGASLLGVDSGVPIVSFIPVMIFAILFGLSMDYNVFLLSRVHEAYNEGERPRQSVITGVSRIGKVILFAGLIMASVFLAFVTQPDVTAKMIGLGLGLAILIDVLVVRLIIAPAVVTLLGDKAWWLPKWLDRILPNVSLEGHLVQNRDPRGEPLPGVEVPAQHGHAAPAD
ncbi:MMPL family transporter [Patulibacter sp. SYSU D01012]|uniref:MMPL family transporter n=1 Tax=Patulibacter sp. SYSU D01012 TaxID=2817381 RepID=UPI001B3187D8|nr:MMPL family transporter [Patulibacter sp. SYSU D01012]